MLYCVWYMNSHKIHTLVSLVKLFSGRVLLKQVPSHHPPAIPSHTNKCWNPWWLNIDDLPIKGLMLSCRKSLICFSSNNTVRFISTVFLYTQRTATKLPRYNAFQWRRVCPLHTLFAADVTCVVVWKYFYFYGLPVHHNKTSQKTSTNLVWLTWSLSDDHFHERRERKYSKV